MVTESVLEKRTIERYIRTRPLAFNIALALMKSGEMTATELSNEFNISVPTMYRLTKEMEELGLLIAKQLGRKRLFSLNAEAAKQIEAIAPSIQELLKGKTTAQNLFVARLLKEEFAVPMNPRYINVLLRTALKSRIKQLLPNGIRRRRPITNIVFGEKPSFDLTVGTNSKVVAIDIKTVDSPKSIMESIGRLASFSSVDIGLEAIVPVYLIHPVPVRGTEMWLMSTEEVERTIAQMSRQNFRILPVVMKVTEEDLLNPSFIESLATKIVQKIEEATAG